MKKPNGDVSFSIILLLFTIFVFQQTYKFPKEAALFPRIFAITLAILAIILLIRSLKVKPTDETKKIENYKSPILIIIGLIVYALILKIVGYIIATFLLSSYVIYSLGYRDIKKMLFTSVIAVTLTYIVFKIILGVNLPEIFFLV